MSAAKSSTKKQVKSAGSRKKKDQVTSDVDTVIASFVACPRCSFFLTAYRLIHDDFESAVEHKQGHWLDLTWNPATRNLVYKTYGCRIEQDAYHFEGVCKECRRAFVYDLDDQQPPSASFSIAVISG